MKSEPALDSLLHLAIFIVSVGVVGVFAVAVIERMAGSGSPLIKRRHLVGTIVVLAVVVLAERIYHLVE